MAPSYYVIELTARWLAVLLAALAAVMILAFVFGYGAAWSVLEREARPSEAVAVGPPRGTPTPTPVEVRIAGGGPSPTVEVTAATTATATPPPPETSTPVPAATATPQPAVPPEEKIEGFWVQVVASTSADALGQSRAKVEELGFGRARQRVVTSSDPGGNELHKLRVGPFPDRESAERVAKRMQVSGFPDAWVVAP